MRTIFLAGVALASSLLTSALDLSKALVTINPGEKINPGTFRGQPRYLTWLADSVIKSGVAPTNAYTASAFYSGVLLAYERTKDQKYFDYVRRQVDIILYPAWGGGEIALYNNSRSIDDIRIGHSFLDMYEATNNTVYLEAAQTLKTQIDNSYRTPDGGFYHRFPAYIDQMWLDGIWMLDVYYARWTALFTPKNNTAWDDIALQYDLIHAGTTSNASTNGLPVHGFDYSKKSTWANPETGAAPHVWGRAVGWYFMALVDALSYFPKEHKGRARMLNYLKEIADAVVKAQDRRTKGWWLVMTPGYEGKHGNYIESSGTAMFVASLLKAVRLGYLRGEKYRRVALEGYALLTKEMVYASKPYNDLALEWTVQTGSLSSNGTFEYYASQPLFENDLKGVAPFLFSSYEYELLRR